MYILFNLTNLENASTTKKKATLQGTSAIAGVSDGDSNRLSSDGP